MGGPLARQPQMRFGLVALGGRSAERTQRHKTTQDRAACVGQIILNADGDAACKRCGLLQKAADGLHGLGLAERGVGVRHDAVLHAAPDLDAQLPGDGEGGLPCAVVGT